MNFQDGPTSSPDRVTEAGLQFPAEPVWGGSSSALSNNEGETVVRLTRSLEVPVLGVGGDLKNTICLARGNQARISRIHGDLRDARDYQSFLHDMDLCLRSVGGEKIIVAHDLHPAYQSTVWAKGHFETCIAVQHHHAHAASCIAEWGIEGPTLAIVGDGVGLGLDRAAWGGEVLVLEHGEFQRFAHLRYFGLPGADAAALETWRPALGLVQETTEAKRSEWVQTRLSMVVPHRLQLARQQLVRNLNTPMTSSLGRLFDGIAFLAGLCDRNIREGQAAIRVEECARTILSADDPVGELLTLPTYPIATINNENSEILDWRPMVDATVAELCHGLKTPPITARFHATMIECLADAALRASRSTGIRTVSLSGGCFQNRLLREGLFRRLSASGMRVATHQVVSPGDAGLSLGQVVVAGDSSGRRAALTGSGP